MLSNAALKTNNVVEISTSRPRVRTTHPDFVLAPDDQAREYVAASQSGIFRNTTLAVFHRIHSALPDVNPQKEIAELLAWCWYAGARTVGVFELDADAAELNKRDYAAIARLTKHIRISSSVKATAGYNCIKAMENSTEADFLLDAATWVLGGADAAYMKWAFAELPMSKFLP